MSENLDLRKDVSTRGFNCAKFHGSTGKCHGCSWLENCRWLIRNVAIRAKLTEVEEKEEEVIKNG